MFSTPTTNYSKLDSTSCLQSSQHALLESTKTAITLILQIPISVTAHLWKDTAPLFPFPFPCRLVQSGAAQHITMTNPKVLPYKMAAPSLQEASSLYGKQDGLCCKSADSAGVRITRKAIILPQCGANDKRIHN